MSKPITVDYFTDILCVWAWIVQQRIEELNKQFADRIEIRHQYLDIFGNTATRIQDQWKNNGLYDGFGDHVTQSAAPFEAAPVNAEIWHKVRPTTSANAHLILKATELAHGSQVAADFALSIRKAFFVDALDISHFDTLDELLMREQIELAPVHDCINNGKALAALIGDFQKAKQYEIKGSPTLVLDNGRQTLYGNVCYRVIHTNVEELLNNLASNSA